MGDEQRFQELKEKEIARLTSTDDTLEPKKGILSDDEILIYAGESEEASRIRLKRGIGTFNDKWHIYGMKLSVITWFLLIMLGPGLFLFNVYAGLIFLLIIFFIWIYIFIIHNFKDKNIVKNVETPIEEPKISNTDDLLLLFESKEKIAREMIEKKFPAPQLTNSKFNGALDNCRNVVESQIEILNAITPTDKTKYEISSRKNLIKQLISKVDDLTNELILSEENNIEDVIDEMDNLINSVKDYE